MNPVSVFSKECLKGRTDRFPFCEDGLRSRLKLVRSRQDIFARRDFAEKQFGVPICQKQFVCPFRLRLRRFRPSQTSGSYRSGCGKTHVRKDWKFDLDELFPIALSSGIGRLIPLVAILFGAQGGRS
jgi:hypothetical protein